jgi:hypothetical protein
LGDREWQGGGRGKREGLTLTYHTTKTNNDLLEESQQVGDATWSDVERTIANLWCKELMLPTIGRDDDFLDVGGNATFGCILFVIPSSFYPLTYSSNYMQGH